MNYQHRVLEGTMLEAKCTTCGETFVPADETDTEHMVTADGVPCGGQGQILGQYATAR